MHIARRLEVPMEDVVAHQGPDGAEGTERAEGTEGTRRGAVRISVRPRIWVS